MSEILLNTKLVMPPPRPSSVRRRQLIDKANQGLAGKLILIDAPAGYGKTSFIVDWLSQGATTGSAWGNRDIAWLTLSESDNDPVRFMAYVVAAIRRAAVAENLGQGVHALMRSPGNPIQAAISLLMNEIAALNRTLILVLDDYHLIHHEMIHQAVTYLLDYQPPNLKLVLLTRTEPPLPLARLRLGGELCELTTADLRFSAAETALFFQHTHGISLTSEQVAVLDAQTEGWASGLQAAALSLQHGQDVDRFLEEFSGSQRFVLDYLADEVYRQQPKAIQSFLRQTAVCDRFCASLCDVLMAGDLNNHSLDADWQTSQQMLEYLDAANLFILPLDDHRQWFRYHPLFQTFLQTQLARTKPEKMSVCHGRAAQWHAENGLVDEAIGHWLAAGEPQQAAALITAQARLRLMRGERITLQRWLKALPQDLVLANPHLCLAQATALTFVRDIEGIETYLAAAETAVDHLPNLPAADIDEVLAGVAVYRAMVAMWQGQLEQTARLSREALAKLPAQETYLTGLASLLLGLTVQPHDLPGANEAFFQALAVGKQTGDIMLVNTAVNNLASSYIRQGKLPRAADLYQEAVARASDGQGRPFPVAGGALLGLAQITREWNDLERAEDYLGQALSLAQKASLPDMLLEARLTQALLHWARQDWRQTQIAFSDCESLLQAQPRPAVLHRLAALKARVALAQGRKKEAIQWTQTCGLTLDDDPTIQTEAQHFILLRIYISQARELAQVQQRLSDLKKVVEANGRVNSQIAICILQSLAYSAQQSAESAQAALQKAVALAEPGGYVRIFADEGKPMTELLRPLARSASETGSQIGYIGKLLAAAQAPPQPANSLVEPLTKREMEVLQLIAAGLTNKQIADTLAIALSTVKRHINHIYGKLNVNNRTRAVARARELHLLK